MHLRYVKVATEKPYNFENPDTTIKGYFHEWTTLYFNGSPIGPNAIVEKEDGTIGIYSSSQIKFEW